MREDAEYFIKFQPTLPTWGATLCVDGISYLQDISTHAPHVGSDKTSQRVRCLTLNFNPRSPRGERQNREKELRRIKHFNPRSPRGERLLPSEVRKEIPTISTHAPHVGSDQMCFFIEGTPRGFQPTLPTWGATVIGVPIADGYKFQPTLPTWGATWIRL